MNPDPSLKKSRERVKLALIPVLSVVLWLVLRNNSEETPVAELVAPPSEVAVPARRVPGGTSRASRTRTPAITLAQALRHNPFATPAALSAGPSSLAANDGATQISDAERNSAATLSAAEADNRLLEQFARQEASVVSRGPNGWVAVVDGKPVSVGDWLDSRLQVVAIGPEGVTVTVQNDPAK